MHLELATTDDVQDIVDLGKEIYKDTPYPMEFDEDKVFNLVTQFLSGPKEAAVAILLKDNEKTVGVLAAVAQSHLFTQEVIATELIWYVKPKYRSKGVLKLLEAFEFWAERIGCKNILVATVEGLGEELMAKIYKRRGYERVEQSFMKRV